MAPEEVEQLVTFPIETALNGMPGVTRVRSTSGVGLSILYAEFDWGTDIYRNRQLVAERLALVQGAAARRHHAGDGAGVVDHGRDHADRVAAGRRATASRRPPARWQAREYADFVLRPRLLSIPGVSQVIPIGGDVRQLRVEPDTARMAQFGVSLTQIEQALRGFAGNAGGGFIDLNSREYLIRHLARTNRVEDLAGLAVAWKDGRPILLEQVAACQLRRRAQARRRRLQRRAGGGAQRAEAARGRHRQAHRRDRSRARRTGAGPAARA